MAAHGTSRNIAARASALRSGATCTTTAPAIDKPQIRGVGASLGMKRATSSRAASVSVLPARRRALRCRSACPRAGSERPAEYAWRMPTTPATQAHPVKPPRYSILGSRFPGSVRAAALPCVVGSTRCRVSTCARALATPYARRDAQREASTAHALTGAEIDAQRR